MSFKRGESSGERSETARILESLKELPYLDEDFLRFRMDMADAYARAQARIIQAGQESLLKREKPVLPLGRDDVCFDAALIKQLLDDMVSSLEDRKAQSKDLAAIAAKSEENKDFIADMTIEALFDPWGSRIKDIAAESGAALEAVILCGRTLAVPFMVEAARMAGLKPAAQKEPERTCPVCRSKPLFAKLRMKDGKRILVCSICETEWTFPRLMCPHCGNTDQNSLAVLKTEDAGARWLEVCEKCKTYIKTVDERKLERDEKVKPFIEETLTLYLDMLAEREGYERNLF